ncbi:MAG: 16S rRNA (cytidine(1402)-2'-O)-methyltransferase [Desulfuromonas sp.]|nr:MAG: 16S rRNA (cytidine(1402)-2'-O)-methyltransferase [Desulfuromonas sp.]
MADSDQEKTLDPGTLYVVATPIGNLEDLTFRALRVLQQADLIAAEDTRHSRKLCNYYAINTQLTSYYAHNEAGKGAKIVDELKKGKRVALISDAGTPAISDPGYLLVRRCREEGLPVVSVPGPSALVAAVSISGLPSDKFFFTGFVPTKSAQRRAFIENICDLEQTVVCYESPRRLVKTLELMIETLGSGREVAVVRELTKLHEEVASGNLADVCRYFSEKGVRGEIVLLIAPSAQKVQTETVREALIRVQGETGMPMRQVVKQVARDFGLSGSDVYRESLTIRRMEGVDENG